MTIRRSPTGQEYVDNGDDDLVQRIIDEMEKMLAEKEQAEKSEIQKGEDDEGNR